MSESNLPLVNKKYILEKYPGKGGWVYAIISEIPQNKRAPFGWVKVKGSIDEYELRNYKLMPMGNGKLFLPVKAEIRKKIGKKEGDTVHIILYEDDAPLEIPEEFIICLQDDPTSYNIFINFTEGQQKEYIDWIYSAKREETRVKRMAEALNKIGVGKRLRDG